MLIIYMCINSLSVRPVQAVENSPIVQTSPIRVSSGSANVSGAFQGKPMARIVAQTCPTTP